MTKFSNLETRYTVANPLVQECVIGIARCLEDLKFENSGDLRSALMGLKRQARSNQGVQLANHRYPVQQVEEAIDVINPSRGIFSCLGPVSRYQASHDMAKIHHLIAIGNTHFLSPLVVQSVVAPLVSIATMRDIPSQQTIPLRVENLHRVPVVGPHASIKVSRFAQPFAVRQT